MADVAVTLRWTGEGLRFDGGARDGAWIRLDGDGETGPAPMQTLLLALAGCMAADVVNILGKMRLPLEGLEFRIEGDRAPEPPRRYLRLRMVCETRGIAAADEDKVRRALALSEEKYCSVLHTLRPDLDIGTRLILS
ncbi:MAG TPA: OsmC family protein [Longimicrobiales bacterium]